MKNFLKFIHSEVKEFTYSLLSDNSGGISTVRIINLIWALSLTFVWVYIALNTGTIPEIPQNVLAITGMLIGGKVIQRFGEKPEE